MSPEDSTQELIRVLLLHSMVYQTRVVDGIINYQNKGGEAMKIFGRKSAKRVLASLSP
jgi:hypothetical protein